MEPLYEGEPILAVAAVDEATAAEAIELISIDYEPLPFVIDPLTDRQQFDRAAERTVELLDSPSGIVVITD